MQWMRPLIKIFLNQSAVSHMTGGSTVWSKDWTECPRLLFHGLSKLCKSFLSTRSWSVCFGHVALPGCRTLSTLVECRQWPQNSTWRWTASLITTGAGEEKTMTSPPGKEGQRSMSSSSCRPLSHMHSRHLQNLEISPTCNSCNISIRPQSQNSPNVFTSASGKSLWVFGLFSSHHLSD